MTSYKKETIVDSAVFLFLLLFVYAAGSKVMEYDTFVAQLTKSPILSKFSFEIAFAIPLLEVLVACLLITPKYRLCGLFASFGLMCLFTFYIAAILLFSEKLPCSCGGILSSMTWKQHLVFNMTFIGVGLLGIRFHDNSVKFLTKLKLQLAITLSCFLIIGVLYSLAEIPLVYTKGFSRRIDKNFLHVAGQLEISKGIYYLAGNYCGRYYFACQGEENKLFSTNTELNHVIRYQIKIKDAALKNVDFVNTLIEIDSPFFRLTNGKTGRIYKGKFGKWVAKELPQKFPYFLQSVRLAQNSFVFLSIASKKLDIKNHNIIGKSSGVDKSVIWHENLLVEDKSGFLGTSGVLMYNKRVNKLMYMHYYSNKILVLDTNLKLFKTFRTIDTITIPQVKPQNIGNEKYFTSETDPIVNKTASLDGEYLFVNSNLMAGNETRKEFDRFSVIDVYNLNSGKYCLSFYLPDCNYGKIKIFYVIGNKILVIYEKKIILFVFDKKKLPNRIA